MTHAYVNQLYSQKTALRISRAFIIVSIVLGFNLASVFSRASASPNMRSSLSSPESLSTKQDSGPPNPARVSQCNQLAGVVNQSQGFMLEFESSIEAFSTNAAQVENLDEIKAAAEEYALAVSEVVASLDELVIELEATELSDEQLTTYRDRYSTLVQGFSSALTQAGNAMNPVLDLEAEADLPTAIDTSQQQTAEAVQRLQELAAEETALVTEVNAYCGATLE